MPARFVVVATCFALLALLVVPLGASIAAAPAAAAWPTADVTITGHGYGHGRGLGQYGAYGYALNGDSDAWILDHFYGGTADSVYLNPPLLTVRLMGQDGSDLFVTSGGGMTIGGMNIAPGGAVRVYYSGGQYLVSVSPGCGSAFGASTAVADPTVSPVVTDPGNNVTKMLTLCSGTTYRGQLRLAFDGTEHTVSVVPMELYLYGVVPRESPASWANAPGGISALRAQAVAARSYAWAESRYSYARTCDTTSCQVYGGAARNGSFLEDPRTTQAVGETEAHVRRFSDGTIARTEFSSSTGGFTAGGTFPAVIDEGDTAASPYHNWSVTVPASSIESAYGVGTLTELTVLSRNGLSTDGGRVLTMRVGGTAKSVDTTGNGFAAALGLRSNWFSISSPPPPPPPPPATVKAWFLRGGANGSSDTAFTYGNPDDTPMLCDWFGVGMATPGVVRGDRWVISRSGTGASVDANFIFGNPGDTPLCGDWDGNGTETPGLWRNGVFFFSNDILGTLSYSVAYGIASDKPIVGRWGGGPYDIIGVDRDAQYLLSGGNIAPEPAQVFYFGVPSDVPVVGDWDGNGTETIGLRRGDRFHLADDPTSGAANRVFVYGNPGDTPLAGRRSGGSAADVGVARAV